MRTRTMAAAIAASAIGIGTLVAPAAHATTYALACDAAGGGWDCAIEGTPASAELWFDAGAHIAKFDGRSVAFGGCLPGSRFLVNVTFLDGSNTRRGLGRTLVCSNNAP